MRTRTARRTNETPEPEVEPQTAPTRRRKASSVEPAQAGPIDEVERVFGPYVPNTTPLFTTAPDQVMQIQGMKMPDMQHGFQTIVEDLFESGFDVAVEYKAVRDALEIKDALTPERLKRAANVQESIANRAHQLYIIAKVEVMAYMRETESIYGAIREAAIQSMEMEKARKTRTKMITEQDAKSEAARLFPDEWADICTRRDRAEAMLKQLENMSQLARSRCYTVSAMAAPGSRSV